MWLKGLYRRVRALLRSEALHDEIDEEMRFHIEMRAEENVRAGMSPEEARREAERRFGGLTRMKERGYDVRGGRWLETLWQDLRYGARSLRKNPGFTLVSVLTLAIGVGANTAIFSVVNAVLLRPLPYPDPDRLVMVFETEPQLPTAPVAVPDYRDWKEQNDVFEAMAAGREGSANLTGSGEPQRVSALPVTAGFFEMLGAAPAAGRFFRRDEEQPGSNIAVLTHELWQSRFGSDPSVVGKKIILDGQSVEVVGIAPRGFLFPSVWGLKPDLFVPFAPKKDENTRGTHSIWVMGRLKPGVTVERAQDEMEVISARLTKQYPESNTDIGVRIVPLREQLVGKVETVLLVMFGAVGFVLLIACANVANLMLTRTISRQREIAVRVALGASGLRILRQLFTESLLLSLLGGAAGVLLAAWGVSALVRLSPTDYLPRTGEIGLSAGVLAFTFAASLLTALLFGLAPAFHSARPDPGESLKEGSRAVAGGLRSLRLRRLLVAAEVALGLVLLIGAGLMLRSLQKLMQVDPGFDPDDVLTMRVELPESRYSEVRRRTAFVSGVIERTRGLPGVESAAASSQLPLAGGPNGGIEVEGRPSSRRIDQLVQPNAVTPDYFHVLKIPLLKGRQFDGSETPESAKVVVINQTLANRFWPGEDPVGKRLSWGKGDTPEWREVIGVVGDVRQWGLTGGVLPEVYFPYTQRPGFGLNLLVRSSADAGGLTNGVRASVWEADKELPVFRPMTMRYVINRLSSVQRFQSLLLSIFGVTALILAAVGIYGVVAYTVAQRTHEIGIRVALGAQRRDVLRLMLRQGLRPALLGVAVGLAGAFALTRVMGTLLFGVTTTDLITFLTTPLFLLGIALLACYVPARRAAEVNPSVALRYE